MTRSTSGGHISSPPIMRQKRKIASKNYKLSNSASTNSMHTLPRPKSYVPFQGCVETPPPPPGRGMHEILHAMSYAPTTESFSYETRNLLPKIPQSPKLVKKSRSFASLMCHYVPDEQTNYLINHLNPVLYVKNQNEPVYAPTNPLNHPENLAVCNAHPPVIYPPPDLVPASTFRPKSPVKILPNSPQPALQRSLSSASSSGFETARSSSASSSMSSMFEASNSGGLQGFHGQNNVLESIRETSPMVCSSRF